MSMENSSFRGSSSQVRERLQNQVGTIADMAINSVFEDSIDINQALTEALES